MQEINFCHANAVAHLIPSKGMFGFLRKCMRNYVMLTSGPVGQ